MAFLSMQTGADLAAARTGAGTSRAPDLHGLRPAAADFLAAAVMTSPGLSIRSGESYARRWLSQDVSSGSPTAPSEQKTPLYKRKWFLAGAVAVVAAAAALLASGGGNDAGHVDGTASLPGFPPPPEVRPDRCGR
jgi:hypothetical protein